MPRVALTVSLIAWRVPNDTSAESVARIWVAEISAIAAVSAELLCSPIAGPSALRETDTGFPAGGSPPGAHEPAARAERQTRASAFECMLCYPDDDGCNGSERNADCLR